MFLCDYQYDLGFIQKRVKPNIKGIELSNNLIISPAEVLLIASNYIPINGYYEVEDKEAFCSTIGRKRIIVLQVDSIILELDYYNPFTELDWNVFNALSVAAETIPEKLSDKDVKTLLKDF